MAFAGVGVAILVAFGTAAVASGDRPAPETKQGGDVQAKHGKDKDEGGWLDALGLSSLEDVPWEAFPVGLALSALIGTVGGIIYVGLLGEDSDGD